MSLWSLLKPKNLITAATIFAMSVQGYATHVLPQGKQIHRSHYTEEPSLLGEFFHHLADNSLSVHMDAYKEKALAEVDSLLEGKTHWELNNYFGMKDEVSWGVYDNKFFPHNKRPNPIVPLNDDYSEFGFTRAPDINQDMYSFRPYAGGKFITGAKVFTEKGNPENIIRVWVESIPEEYYPDALGWETIERGMYGDLEYTNTPLPDSILAKARKLVDSINTKFDISAIEKSLPDYVPLPEKEYPDIPFEATVFNIPILPDRRRKSTAETKLEIRIDQLTEEEKEKGLVEIDRQYKKDAQVFDISARHLFATQPLVKEYVNHTNTENYQKGFIEPSKRAFNKLKRSWHAANLVPDEYIFVGLGSSDGKWDEKIISALDGWRKLKKYISIDDETNYVNAQGTIADRFEKAEVSGRPIDLENDQEGLEEYIQEIKKEKIPIVYLAKDLDTNWLNPTAMYKSIIDQMGPDDILIWGAPLEHKDMYNTYDGIKPAGDAYLTHLNFDPTKWSQQKTRYDHEKQEFQISFICEETDFVTHKENKMKFTPGMIINHLRSRRKDLSPEFEKMGAEEVDAFDGEGYKFGFYRKKQGVMDLG